MAGSCDYGNESSRSIKDVEFLDLLKYYHQHVKNYSSTQLDWQL